jgi:hypothetical protein
VDLVQVDLARVDLAQVDLAQVDLAQVDPVQVLGLDRGRPVPVVRGRRRRRLCRAQIRV